MKIRESFNGWIVGLQVGEGLGAELVGGMG